MSSLQQPFVIHVSLLNAKFYAILFHLFVTRAVKLRHVSFLINEYYIRYSILWSVGPDQ